MISKSKLWSFIRLRRRPRALLVDECVSPARIILYRCAALLRRISLLADNPPKPWRLRSEASFSAQGRRRVFLWRYHGLCPWGSIFILISGAVLLSPVIVNAEDERARSCNHTFNRRSWFKFHRPLLKNYSNLPPQTFQEFCCR